MSPPPSVPPPSDSPRYAPAIPFPPYRYVPGVTPHPLRDEAGHLRGRTRSLAPFSAATWTSHEGFLHACDLYNHGYFWEAHELWEELWRELSPADASRPLLQGLIQVSAAHLKLVMADAAGATKLAARGLEKLARVPRVPRARVGIDVDRFASEVRVYFAAISAASVSAAEPTWPALRLDRAG